MILKKGPTERSAKRIWSTARCGASAELWLPFAAIKRHPQEDITLLRGARCCSALSSFSRDSPNWQATCRSVVSGQVEGRRLRRTQSSRSFPYRLETRLAGRLALPAEDHPTKAPYQAAPRLYCFPSGQSVLRLSSFSWSCLNETDFADPLVVI
jgi:hypothetical protein